MSVNLNKNIQSHRNIIKNKLDFYNNTFKDIHFIHLDGGDDWQTELDTVLKFLDDNPIALDYKHPKELQQDLIFATIKRLKFMLENAAMSSTLFRVGDKSTIQQSNLCVVSLNPVTLILDESEPLRYMLDYSDERVKKINPSRYIDAKNFIKYSFDHEVFHCLDSFLYGGAPMTFEILGGEYNQVRRESAADAFALIMHLKMNGKLTNFARNMTHIRALSLYNNCANHNTFNTMLKTLRLDTNQFKAMSIMEIISLSKQVANETIGTYTDFKNQYALDLRAIKHFNNELLLSEDKLNDLEKIITEQSKLDFLIERSRYFYKHLFTNTIIDLESIQLD